ncbi:hypothetical protein [Microbulbifer sp. HZ11]|uniref:hypothetical protein n=1 Tax=unclassified Microbulbifer TaxID=2619833 RepID=UPI0005B771B8|nr:hypothetical protein [Microbulbifer sp. HZ11]
MAGGIQVAQYSLFQAVSRRTFCCAAEILSRVRCFSATSGGDLANQTAESGEIPVIAVLLRSKKF